jgi:DNA topoisomerase-1
MSSWIRRLGSKASGFRYVNADGRPIRDRRALARINALRVPPAWRDVHIATTPRSAIQAWGFDARGRKQYRYNERAVERRELRKYHRVRQLAKELPRVRGTLHDDARPDARANSLDADTVAATVLRLISETFCRIGGERYAKENGTFGITTLKKSHVLMRNGIVTFAYKGKSNIRQRQVVTDPQLVRLVRRQFRTPGQRLFTYVRKGKWQVITAREVNDYLQRNAGGYSAKDFRTWGGTLRAATVLAELGPAKTETEAKKKRRRGDAVGVGGTWKHGDDLSEIVRASDGDRALHGRRRNDWSSPRSPRRRERRTRAFPRGEGTHSLPG